MTKPLNRQGYIATLRATSITEEQGLSILVYMAEKCDDDLRLSRRKFTSKHIASMTGMQRLRALRRIRHLRESKALKIVQVKRVAYYQLPTETELQRFA